LRGVNLEKEVILNIIFNKLLDLGYNMEVQTHSYLIQNVSSDQCMSEVFLKGCISNIAQRLQQKNISVPTVIRRNAEPSGLTIFSSFNESHVVVTSFKFNQSVMVHVYSHLNQIFDLKPNLSRHFSQPSSNIKKYSTVATRNNEAECQEPRCRYPADYNWGGLKVCQDHFEQYQNKRLDDINSMDNY
jgi:hypothetical protein